MLGSPALIASVNMPQALDLFASSRCLVTSAPEAVQHLSEFLADLATIVL